MGEMEDKIQQLLSSEDGMKKIMSLASAIMSGEKAKSSEAETSDKTGDPVQEENKTNIPDEEKIKETVKKIVGENKKNITSENKLNLLTALKPFLTSGRQQNIDRATRMLKTAKVAKTALDEFKGGKTSV